MKYLKYALIGIISFFIVTTAYDAGVTKIEITKATYDGKFVIEGKGSGQIQIVLFDLKNEPLFLTTVEAKNGTFKITLPEITGLKDGNYKVKAASYDGKKVDDETIKVVVPKNPKTGDGVIISIIIGVISLLGLLISYNLKKQPVRN